MPRAAPLLALLLAAALAPAGSQGLIPVGAPAQPAATQPALSQPAPSQPARSRAVPADLLPLEESLTPSVPARPGLPSPALPYPAPALPGRTTPAASVPATFIPPDPLYPQQWNLQAIGMPQAWALERGAPVTVAVLDTGYAPSGELGARAVNGYDFVSDPARSGDGDGRDPDASGVGPLAYHGEAVANLIGAAQDGAGVAGINPRARVLEVRVAGTDGLIAPQDLADALRWAAGLPVAGVPVNRAPARILNLSLYVDFIPLSGCDAHVAAAIDAVTARGALVVAGAANDARDAAGYTPAGCHNVLTVTATDIRGARASYANWGGAVALAAPGGDRDAGLPLFSRGQLLLRDGTSFAAPEVSGVASLLLGLRPALSPAALGALLRRSASPFPGGACDPLSPARSCGSGLLNAPAALRAALLLPASMPASTPKR